MDKYIRVSRIFSRYFTLCKRPRNGEMDYIKVNTLMRTGTLTYSEERGMPEAPAFFCDTLLSRPWFTFHGLVSNVENRSTFTIGNASTSETHERTTEPDG